MEWREYAKRSGSLVDEAHLVLLLALPQDLDIRVRQEHALRTWAEPICSAEAADLPQLELLRLLVEVPALQPRLERRRGQAAGSRYLRMAHVDGREAVDPSMTFASMQVAMVA